MRKSRATRSNLPQSLRRAEERVQIGENRIEGLKDFGEGLIVSLYVLVFFVEESYSDEKGRCTGASKGRILMKGIGL
jgi:hypothetical protein